MKLLAASLRRTLLRALVLMSALGLLSAPLLLSGGQAPAPPAHGSQSPPAADSESARASYGRIPLSFEANLGQAEGSVDFLARGAGYALFLKPAEAVFVLTRNVPAAGPSKTGGPELSGRDVVLDLDSRATSAAAAKAAVLRMRLVGARASAAAEGLNELESKSNYIVGDDPSRWRTNVPAYGLVRYAEVYPGVDVVYYGNQRQLEYDFRVAPGADARRVALEFEGADEVEVSGGGELLLKVGGETITQPKPFVYQEAAGARREVEGGYEVGRDGRVRFALGEYDPALPLVIDPVIVYSTYLGGGRADQALGVAVDSAGNAYLAGFTTSTDFPTATPIQAANGGASGTLDAFVAKLNAAGNALVYSTYLGGSGNEQARAIAVDSSGNAYVTGNTGSSNFPTANAIQAANGGSGQDAFVAKLNAAGSALVYSTYLGGNGSLESGEGIAVDSAGNAYLTGVTNSTNFPTANAIQAANGGSGDAFVTKLNAAGSALVYSTYLGGSGSELGRGVAVDSAGNAYVTGETPSTNFPTANAIQAANAGGTFDAFLSKLNAAGTAFVYSTYLGGTDLDNGQAVAVDSAGNAYLTGVTNSTNFPTANAIQPVNGGTSITQEAFVTKVNAAGNAFVYSTYLGGPGGDVGEDIKVDSAGNAYVVGGTGTFNTFPTANALQCQRLGNGDPFITKLNAAGNAFVYSTYYGGSATSGGEIARGVAVDSAGNAYVAGNAASVDFPAVNPAQGVFAGGDGLAGDAFLFKLSDASAGPASSLQFTQTNVPVQENVTSLTLTVQRAGDTSGAVTVDYATAAPNVGAASERADFTTALGTLRFAAGETSKTIELLVNEDSFSEGQESFNVVLSNPTGGATLLCAGAVATVQITDDTTEPTTNAIDDATVFTGQHYHDFLNRQADAAGLNFWANQIIACGGDAACVERTRTQVSQAFFLSIEFLDTGYYVFRFYRTTFTDSAARPRGMPRYREFLRDQREVGQGVVVNAPGWEQVLEANKREFARRWVQRSEFLARFPESMGPDEYINKLFANSGVTPTPAEFNIAFDAYNGPDARANALRAVVESNSVYNRQFNEGFVLSQYIGYLRRNPNDAPEPTLDYSGFDFWLAKLESFSQPGENLRDPATAQRRVARAEMVRAFIQSFEYRQRFGQ